MHRACFSPANLSVSPQRPEEKRARNYAKCLIWDNLSTALRRHDFAQVQEVQDAVHATVHGDVAISNCRSNRPGHMTMLQPQTLRLQGQRDRIAAHGKITDEYEDHIVAEIARESGRPVEEVAEMFSSQLASLGAGATIDLFLDVIAAKRVRAALRHRADENRSPSVNRGQRAGL